MVVWQINSVHCFILSHLSLHKHLCCKQSTINLSTMKSLIYSLPRTWDTASWCYWKLWVKLLPGCFIQCPLCIEVSCLKSQNSKPIVLLQTSTFSWIYWQGLILSIFELELKFLFGNLWTSVYLSSFAFLAAGNY